MTTPLTDALETAESALAVTMTTVPIALLVIAVILRGVPYIKEWSIGLILWAIGIAVGLMVTDEEGIKRTIGAAFIQGTLSVGVALIYATGIREFLRTQGKGNKDGG